MLFSEISKEDVLKSLAEGLLSEYEASVLIDRNDGLRLAEMAYSIPIINMMFKGGNRFDTENVDSIVSTDKEFERLLSLLASDWPKTKKYGDWSSFKGFIISEVTNTPSCIKMYSDLTEIQKKQFWNIIDFLVKRIDS